MTRHQPEALEKAVVLARRCKPAEADKTLNKLKSATRV